MKKINLVIMSYTLARLDGATLTYYAWKENLEVIDYRPFLAHTLVGMHRRIVEMIMNEIGLEIVPVELYSETRKVARYTPKEVDVKDFQNIKILIRSVEY